MVGALADAWRIVFLAIAAPIVGSTLLLAIARVTGARWQGIEAPARFAPVLIVGGAAMGLAQLGSAVPPHLRLWMAWWAVGLRGAIAGAVLAYAAARLRRGASVTFAAIVLAAYTALVTPVASDWMLGQDPGHPVSAIGMMLTVAAIGAAAALTLARGAGTPATRTDMTALMIAAALGLGYLAYMDYLIVWFGNLPARVPFYLTRGTPAMTALVSGALLAGWVVPVGALSMIGGDRGARLAGMSVLVGLMLFAGWWIAGGAVAVALACVGGGIAIAAVPGARRRAHG